MGGIGRKVTRVSSAGYTLLELLAVMSVIGILLVAGIPSMTDLFDSQEVKGAANQLYSHIQQARSEAIARDTEVFVRFTGTNTVTWAYGLSTSTGCDLSLNDPANASACALEIDDGDGVANAADRVLMVYRGTDFNGIFMAPTLLSGSEIVFEPTQGTAIGNTGNVLLTSQRGRRLLVKVGALGQVRICSPDGSVTGYTDAVPANNADC